MNNYATELEYEKHCEIKRRSYREMHLGTAVHKGVGLEFRMARTVTQMRKILWGEKKKQTPLRK